MNFNFYEQHAQNAKRTRAMKIILPFTVVFVLLAIFALIYWSVDNDYYKGIPNLIIWFVGVFGLWYGGILIYVHKIMDDPVTKVMEAEHAVLIDQQALREVDGAQMLLDVVEELALAYGMEKPAVYIVEDAEYPNAFAVGDEFDSGVAVTRPLLDMCSRSELSGVLGHELAHVKAGDSETTLFFVLFVSSLAFATTIGCIMVSIAPGLMGYSNDDNDDGNDGNDGNGNHRIIAIMILYFLSGWLLFGFVLMITGSIAKLCALLLRFGVSRTREYDADAMSAKINQSPEGLIGALNAIEKWQDLQETDSDADAMSANVNQSSEGLSKVLNMLKEWWDLQGTDNNADGESNDTDDDKLFNKSNHHFYSALYFTDDQTIKHSFWEFHQLFDDHPTIDDRIARLKQV